jgi:hypothetical protein
MELKTIAYIKELSFPQRKYVRRGVQTISERTTRIQSTLLEYGQKALFTKILTDANSVPSSKNTPASLKQAQEQQQQQKNAEDEQLNNLINEMSITDQKVVFLSVCSKYICKCFLNLIIVMWHFAL